MRSLQIAAALVMMPLIGLTATTASANANDFCLTGAIGTSEQSVNCASRWIAADGSRMAPVADPRLTPKTPYNSAGSLWSGSGSSSGSASSSATYSSANNYRSQPQPVWQPPATNYRSSNTGYVRNQVAGHGSGFQSGKPTIVQTVPYASTGQVLVTRGANHNTIYTGMTGHTGHQVSGWSAPAPVLPAHPPISSCASYNSGCGHSSSQGTYSSNNITSGCFTHGPGGQPQSVPCPATVSSTNTWATSQQYSDWPITVVQHTQPPMPQPPVVAINNNGFYNSLSGGVGGTPNVYYGGGGGTFISGGSSSVFARAPILRMRQKNKGGGGGGGGHGGHKPGCGKCGHGGGGHGGGH